jgi:glyoxylase-like metal-dependent hydrolase (beta-lactamase superfamily II)
MPIWVCAACGNHSASDEVCVICADERQWIPPTGQRWTTLDELRAAGHQSDIRELQPGLTGIGAEPAVAIGQRSILVQTTEGNLLWDPSGFIDDAAIDAARERGGVRYVTASHPHFYGCAASWQAAFDATVLVPEADEEWMTALGVVTSFSTWRESVELLPGVTLIQCGGHFPGSAVVHVASGDGALLSGDTVVVTPGADRATFIWSAPNQLPLSEGAVRGIWESVAPYEFDRVYAGWWDRVLDSGAKDTVRRSADRYLELLRGETGTTSD